MMKSFFGGPEDDGVRPPKSNSSTLKNAGHLEDDPASYCGNSSGSIFVQLRGGIDFVRTNYGIHMDSPCWKKRSP